MVQKNLKIWNALRRVGREDIATRSIISNTIQKIYPHAIEIESVKIHGNTILVRTWSHIANSELRMMEWEIKKQVLEKLALVWIRLQNTIKFRFT